MRRSRVALAVGGALAAGVVVGAILTPGYPAVEPELDGSSVWVANAAASVIGLANTANGSIEQVVRTGSVSETHQGDTGVVLVDRSASTVRTVLEGESTPGPAVPITAGATVAVRDDRVLVTASSTGDVWTTSVSRLAQGTPLGDPVVELGSGGVAVLGERDVLAASPGLGRVLRVDEDGESVSSDRAPMSPASPSLQLTALGDDWVLYDAGSGVLSTARWQTSLEAGDVALQQPGPAGVSVVLATEGELLRQTIGVPAAEVLASGMRGTPAAPLTGDRCTFAAWSDGTGWRSCEGDVPRVLALEGMEAGARLSLAERGSATALSAPATGDAWAIDRDGARIGGWRLLQEEPDPAVPDDETEQTEESIESEPQPPVAVDDELGARDGRTTLLPVLVNDSDANGDAIVLTEAATSVPGASVSLANDGTSVRLTLDGASGVVPVRYTISDGTATASATAAVTVRTGNEEPALVRPPIVRMTSGGALVLDALDGWVDPDGDPLAVVAASAEAPDRATVRADGRLELRDGGAGSARSVDVTVSDGTTTATATIPVTVQAGDVPIEADAIAAVTHAGTELVLEPLRSARGGSGELRLHNVNAAGLPVEPDLAAGRIRVLPTTPGVLRFTYVVSDGAATSTSSIAVRVLDSTDASTPPEPRPAHAIVPLSGSVEVPVDALASDPSGGVVALIGIESDDDAVRAEIIDQGRVRLSLVDALEGTATVRYRVSNGIASAAGELTVSARERGSLQPPIARADTVSVRPGGLVDIAVLANDEQPDGLDVALDPNAIAAPASGLLFQDGDRLRYVAEDAAETVHATYGILGPDGQAASAEITIVVSPTAAGTNAPPAIPPREVRVVAGASVDIELPLSSADPNGDPVQLLGQSTPSTLGSVSQVGPSTLRYTAGDYSTGTDTFRFELADDAGAVGEGTVRVAVVDRAPGLPPVLQPDSATMRPGSQLAVPVLRNDRDPAGQPLEILHVETDAPGASAAIEDDAVVVTAAEHAGAIGIVVTVGSATGATATSWLRVDVDPDAVPPPPELEDVQVPIRAVADGTAVTVDPLEHAIVRDGRVDTLSAELPLAADGVSLSQDGTIDIAIGERTRFVPFSVVRSDSGERATAVIAVPGRQDALPQLRPGVAPLQVRSGESTEIPLDDVVETVHGGGALLTDASQVRATHTDNTNPVIDERTLRFVPQAGYFGLASMTFEVTDGETPTDPDGRINRIVLPIEVLPGDDVPLTVLDATLQLEPGTSRTVDLARITRSPDQARLERAVWDLADDPPAGFDATIDGATLTVSAAADAPPGSTAELSVGVDDGAGTVAAPGTISLSVISTTRPLVAPVSDRVLVQRGGSTSLEPLANDESSNPFPGTPLRAAGLRGSEEAVDRGIEVRLRGHVLEVHARPDAAIGTTTVLVRVLDATGDERRAVWNPVSITVQDAPEPPAAPVQSFEGHVDGVVTMLIEPPADNGSPILEYRIVGDGIEQSCGRQTRCRITGLPAGVDVRLQAIAVNAIGPSDPSPLSAPVHADTLPAQVTRIAVRPGQASGTALVSWSAVAQPVGGTAVERYLVRIRSGASERIERVAASETSLLVDGIAPGEAVTIEVAAANGAGVADGAWRWPDAAVPFTGVGAPGTTPVLVTERSASGNVTATWSRVDPGGASAVAYTARVVEAAHADDLACESTQDGAPVGSEGTSATLSVPEGSQSVIAVIADNGWHCSISRSEPVFGRPAAVPADRVRIETALRDDALDLRVATMPSLARGTWLEARVDQAQEGAWQRVPADRWLTPTAALAYGREATVWVRACAPAGAGSTPLCGSPTRTQSLTPLSVHASVERCRPLVPIEATPPQNAALDARAEVFVSFRVDGVWGPVEPATSPAPAGATAVRAWGEVTYRGSGPHRDPVPTEARCGL